MLRSKKEKLPAAQARERAALVARARPFELRSISPDATPEEVAAITAAIAASHGVGRGAAPAADGRGAERVDVGAGGADRRPARRLLARRVAPLRPPRPPQPRVSLTVSVGARRGGHDGRARRGRRHVRDRPRRAGHVTGRRPRGRRPSARTTSPRFAGLEPGTEYAVAVDGAPADEFLPGVGAARSTVPAGRPLATIATVNDVHFGEVECGRLDGVMEEELGPVLRALPGEPPYPETMNRGAIAEIEALDPDVVLVKGDLTNLGTEEEYAAFLAAYGQLGERMHHVRGNHDAMLDAIDRARGRAVRDRRRRASRSRCSTPCSPASSGARSPPSSCTGSTSSRRRSTGRCSCSATTTSWDLDATDRSADYFGINPDDSEALGAVVARAREHRRLLRRSHAPQPGPPLGPGAPGAVRRGQLHEGLPGGVGRVPDLRARLHAGRPAHLGARRAGVDRAHPPDVRRPLPRLRARPPRPPLLHRDLVAPRPPFWRHYRPYRVNDAKIGWVGQRARAARWPSKIARSAQRTATASPMRTTSGTRSRSAK